jgi:hypothetical protein
MGRARKTTDRVHYSVSRSSRSCTNSAAKGSAQAQRAVVRVLSSHPSLALGPTTSNPTIYEVFVYQTCAFSAPFRRKTRANANRPLDGEPGFAALGLHEAGAERAGPWRPEPVNYGSKIVRDLLPKKSRLFWPPGPRAGKNAQVTQGPFPRQETAFYAESVETFEVGMIWR